MSSFEWMELQTLTADIAASRSRLSTARSRKDARLVRLLESEIAAAEDRRTRLLSHITSDLADHPEPVPSDDAGAADRPPPTAAEESPAEAEPQAVPDTPAVVDAAPPETAAWDRLTPADIARAADRLRARRAETLARHAAEVKRLAVERIQVEALEQAIDAFTRKFAAAAATVPRGSVVQFDEAREIRAQGRA